MDRTTIESVGVSINTQFNRRIQRRYVWKKVYNEASTVKVSVIMMNPKVKDEKQCDKVLEKVLTFIEVSENNELNQLNILNLFPFIAENLSGMEQSMQVTNLHKNIEIKENLATIKNVVKNADKIIFAWGSLTPGLSEAHFKTAIADIYHMIRMFNKTENCYVFSIVETNNPLNSDGNPFHPIEGTINGLNHIRQLWMENNTLKINVS